MDDVRRPDTYEWTMRRILHRAECGDRNPLGLEGDELTHEHQLRIRMAMLAIDDGMAVAMRDDLRTLHLRDEGDGLPGMIGDMDVTTARLVDHIGLVPLSVAWMARAGQGLEVEIDHRCALEIDVFDHPDDPVCTTMVRIAEQVHWLTTGTLFVPALPDTMAGAAVGRPLRDVFSHPVLDPLGLVITGATTGSLHDRLDGTYLTVDAERVPASPDDLFAMHEASR